VRRSSAVPPPASRPGSSQPAFAPGARPRPPEGGVHFAGEHTDTDQQGYIDGAARTGERAARELIS
jgi:monoamine oxidase